jgi:hypothetical protein
MIENCSEFFIFSLFWYGPLKWDQSTSYSEDPMWRMYTYISLDSIGYENVLSRHAVQSVQYRAVQYIFPCAPPPKKKANVAVF